ncbi:MAG: IS5 family transposase [Saccharolobus sp.]|uniref:IS5 family transposase n=1 Tax=Saccharolobus sp. TaxID=2100761 RepID=UPI0031792469
MEFIRYDGYKHIKGTKIHVIVSSEALPLSIQLGPRDKHDFNYFIPILESLSVKYMGRPRSRPKEVTGDSAYDTKEIREYLKSRRVKANIDINKKNRRKPKHGRPCRLDKKTYKRMRSAVERFFAWITSFRRITIRYERLAIMFLGFIQLACIVILLRVFR